MRTKDKSKLVEIESFLDNYIHSHGYSPSQREMAEELEMALSTINRYIRELKKEGRIWQSSTGRNIITSELKDLLINYCTAPITDTYNFTDQGEKFQDTLMLPKKHFGSDKYIALRVSDYSLAQLGFNLGSLIIFKIGQEVKENAIVLAKVNQAIRLAIYANRTVQNIRSDKDGEKRRFITCEFEIVAVAHKLIEEKAL